MSAGGEIFLLISSIPALVKAISELRSLNACKHDLALRQDTEVVFSDGRVHKVDVVVKDDNGRDIGFVKQDDGKVQVVADNCGLSTAQLQRQQQLINAVKQRYGYNRVVEQLKVQGYQVVEEQKKTSGEIRLVARKWAA